RLLLLSTWLPKTSQRFRSLGWWASVAKMLSPPSDSTIAFVSSSSAAGSSGASRGSATSTVGSISSATVTPRIGGAGSLAPPRRRPLGWSARARSAGGDRLDHGGLVAGLRRPGTAAQPAPPVEPHEHRWDGDERA